MFKQSGHVVRALTIAGSDSSGGAGIQADLKTFHQYSVYGMSVVTALTAQNSEGVQGIHGLPAQFVHQQFTSVSSDLGMDAIKTGMLASADIIHTVAELLRSRTTSHLVVDPVMVAKGGAPLLLPDATATLTHELLPSASVVTPNLPEAEVLCGHPIRDWEMCHDAAREIADFGPRFVVLKGGHAPAGELIKPTNGHSVAFGSSSFATDIVYSRETGQFTYFVTKRVDSVKTHGTGCTFSAAITALLARGSDPLSAIAGAKAFIYHAVDRAKDWDVGSGHGPTDHTSPATPDYQPEIGRFNVYQSGHWTSF